LEGRPDMNLTTELFLKQATSWPSDGRHIMAQYDDDSVVVYQAYRPAIGRFAARHGYFGGDFKLTRMSWIKPNFLWMMYRSGWGAKEDQEITLAVKLHRSAFDEILSLAVHSTFVPAVYRDHESWKRAVADSDVRLQWDPDHHPAGNPLSRRAIQLGLRGEVLAKYARGWIIEIEDISGFVAEQYQYVASKKYDQLKTPCEQPYPVEPEAVRNRLQLA
jgi:hypothetical protein